MTRIVEKTSLLDAAFTARLDQLDLLSRKILLGKLHGERRSKKRGQSVEFADYRNYVPGDDPRFIDWNIYARLDRLLLKLFTEEEDLVLYVICDISRSTEFGEPNKARYIKQVAAALSYIGLVNANRVHVAAIGKEVRETGAIRGRTKVPRMLDFLNGLEAEEGGDFALACKRFAMGHRQKGLCVLISDFLIKDGFQNGVKYLTSSGYDFFALQILAPQEIEPEVRGDLRLVDVEDQDATEVSITQPVIKKYRETVNAYCNSVKDYVTRRGGAYLLASTGMRFDQLVLKHLRQRRLIG
ncbi:MAG TPA: DUF58 domain-containing protein [Tepidisphaeraceae bacterium]|jgi:uncharacterized protein (DUF58 family)